MSKSIKLLPQPYSRSQWVDNLLEAVEGIGSEQLTRAREMQEQCLRPDTMPAELLDILCRYWGIDAVYDEQIKRIVLYWRMRLLGERASWSVLTARLSNLCEDVLGMRPTGFSLSYHQTTYQLTAVGGYMTDANGAIYAIAGALHTMLRDELRRYIPAHIACPLLPKAFFDTYRQVHSKGTTFGALQSRSFADLAEGKF